MYTFYLRKLKSRTMNKQGINSLSLKFYRESQTEGDAAEGLGHLTMSIVTAGQGTRWNRDFYEQFED